MKLKIVFVGFENDYEKYSLSSLSDVYDVREVNINKLLRKALRRLSMTSGNFEFLIKWLIRIKLLLINSKELVVFKDENDYMPALKSLPYKHTLILRNSISDTKAIRDLSCNIYSFDKNDCYHYGLNLYNQYSPILDIKVDIEQLYVKGDIIFVGKDKGRADFIINIKNALPDLPVNVYIVDGGEIKTNFMTYLDYLKRQLSGDVVLDIVKDGQSSETMRLVEALSSGKKIITNNASVLEHPLYKKENVLYFFSIEYLKEHIHDFLELPFDNYDYNQLFMFSARKVLSDIICNELQV